VDEDPLASYELVFLLGLSFQLLVEQFVTRLSDAGYDDLRPVHGFALQALGPDGATSSELADRLGMTKQAAGQMVDYLQDRGYLQRQKNPLGGRRRLVVLTERGRLHMVEARKILRALESDWVRSIGADRLHAVQADLATMVRAAAGGTIPPLRPVW